MACDYLYLSCEKKNGVWPLPFHPLFKFDMLSFYLFGPVVLDTSKN